MLSINLQWPTVTPSAIDFILNHARLKWNLGRSWLPPKDKDSKNVYIFGPFIRDFTRDNILIEK